MIEKRWIVVAGSRGFHSYQVLCASLDHYILLHPAKEIVIVSGHAMGADQLGEKYAIGRGYTCRVMPADWNQYGKRAGYLRNQAMAEIATDAVIFWDGISHGTKHMIDLCNERRLPVKLIKYLECSTQGNVQFSAWNAHVSVWKKRDSIEAHYQLSKLFYKKCAFDSWGIGTFTNPNDAKSYQHQGNKPVGFMIHGVGYKPELLTLWYQSLWFKFLNEHPDLVTYASGFDVFTDQFKKENTVNCQSDVIRLYVKNRKALAEELSDFFKLLKIATPKEEYLWSLENIKGGKL